MSFLESIEEISGGLFILDNTVRQIPLSKLKVIRGLSREDSIYSMRIFVNQQKNMPHLEVIDLSSLKGILFLTFSVIFGRNTEINIIVTNENAIN